MNKCFAGMILQLSEKDITPKFREEWGTIYHPKRNDMPEQLTAFDNYFTLGLGTSRFPISGPNDIAGIDKSVDLVCHALERGVNYIDTSYIYSAGMAQTVLKEAFARTKKQVGVTVKVMHDMDKTSDDARRRVELQLKAMGIEKAAFFTCWTVLNFTEFEEIMQKGGVYEGAVKLRDEGLIEHICFSAHASPEDIVKIIESGAFEGVTVSYSLLNAAHMQSVLEAAQRKNIGVAVMNPLGGGMIAQNADYFSFARSNGDSSTVHAALRFANAHPAVKIVLAGVNTIEEFDDSLGAMTDRSDEPDESRLSRVMRSTADLKDSCTGCKYCEGCPKGIPTSLIMQKRNNLLFKTEEAWNRTNPELARNIRLFRCHTGDWMPDSPVNPCERCKKCESRCTQKLSIVDSIEDFYNRADAAGFTLSSRKSRLEELLQGKGYGKAGLYPNGGFANLVRAMYADAFGEPEFEWLQFNSDPKMWGEMSGGLPIHAPEEIASIKPDIIIVCTYKYDSEIYNNLCHYEADGIRIVKLHRDNDVPWVF
ncbi:hypothetical protein FACS1894216_11370 [Synergistales bacterium]|nr:hypothetical protein FACS1894216_11370 [Synergistales bacterium]